MSKTATYSPLVTFICTHVPFRTPRVVEENPSKFKIITNCDDPFPPTKVEIIRVNKMNLEYGPEQNRCLNEWRMIYAISKMKILPQYIGICHYRRYFDGCDRIDMKVLNDVGYEIVIGNPVRYDYVLREMYDTETYYGYWHSWYDYQKMREVFYNVYPDSKEVFEEMSRQDYLHNSAMCIMEKDLFLDMADYVMGMYKPLMDAFGFKNDDDALRYVQERKDIYIKPYLQYYDEVMQSRIIGYLLERVWNCWLREPWDDGTKLIDKAALLGWYQADPQEIEVPKKPEEKKPKILV